MGLLFIAMSVGCSLTLAQILKIAENRKMNVVKVLVINYLSGVIISLLNAPEISFMSVSISGMNGWLIGMAIFLGLIFIGNLIVYSKSIDKVGMGVSITAMRMSLVFPIAASLFIFGEELIPIRYMGIILALFSLLLMVPRIKGKSVSGISHAWLPVLIFLMTGVADTGMKVYERLFSSQISEQVFMGGIFFISFLIGMAILLKRGKLHFSFTEIGYGLLTGIVNLYSSIFLLYALRMIPGSIVFPLMNVTLVISGTLIGVWFWKDKPSLKQWSGLLIAIISIVLLLG